MPNAFKEAKKIRSMHPSWTWKKCVREGAKRVKGKHHKVAGTKRRRVHHKKKPVRRKTVTRIRKLHAAEGRAIHSLGSVSSHVSSAKKILEHEIGKLEAQKYIAKKKSTKRKIGKRIAAKKSKYRKLC